MTSGVPLGAASPNQATAEKPGMPAWGPVGTSGSAATRSGLVTNSGRTLPALMKGVCTPVLSSTASIWPPSRSFIAGLLPL
ncbi:hypothetical protein G6F59_018050 [Rhizopus arrhizus]|nr:hypothetical protein G6F59_018050 [Rhizopus arrhizus]